MFSLTCLEHDKTLEILNFHADTILSNPNVLTEKPHPSFVKIIELLQRFGTDEGNEEIWEDANKAFWDWHDPREEMEEN